MRRRRYGVIFILVASLLNGVLAHEVLRLAFHDAIGFSKSGALKLVQKITDVKSKLNDHIHRGTGADGSMILFSDIETAFCGIFLLFTSSCY